MKKNIYKLYNFHFGLFILRLGISVICIWHGFSGIINSFQIDILPLFLVQTIFLIEIISGFFVLFGLFTNVVLIILGIAIMLIIFLVKYRTISQTGFSSVEVDIALLCMIFALSIMGPGLLSLDALRYKIKNK